MNWFGGGFITIINYVASTVAEQGTPLMTENNFNLLTEDGKNILVED